MTFDAEALYRTARRLAEAGDVSGAVFALRGILGQDDGHAGTHVLLGRVLLEQGDGEEARNQVERGLDLAPTDREVVLEGLSLLETLGATTSLAVRCVAYLKRVGPDREVEALLARQAGDRVAGASPRHHASPRPTGPAPGRRLLTILDYAVQPYNLGDLLIYLTGSLVAAEEAGLETIDFCLLSDPTRPHVDPHMRSLIQADNHYFHLLSILPELQLNPRLGSIYTFNALPELNHFLAWAQDRYVLWPSLPDLQAQKYMFYDTFKRVWQHHQAQGRIPQLQMTAPLSAWAEAFFRERTPGTVPVSVNLRNNPHFHAHRNSNLPAWRTFFEHCLDRVPVTFVVTCAATEVEPSLRSLPNLVFAKDHHSTVLQDLALIHAAAFHLGAPSGPAALPIFQAKPYHIFHCDMLPHLDLYDGSLELTPEGELRYAFAEPLQTFGVAPETAEDIQAHFERIWASRDWPSAWGARPEGSAAAAKLWMT